MRRLEGKVALITGSGNGIGRAGAELFAREGAKVVIAELDEAAGEAVANGISRSGGDAHFVRTDVTDEGSVKSAIAAAITRYGQLNVLYNNAGASSVQDGPVTTSPAEIFWSTIKLNLFGTWLFCRNGIPELVRAGGGSIINTASIAGLMGLPKIDAYTASKGGVAALTRSMAVEFAAQKIRVNAIAPTGTLSPRVRSNLEKHPDRGTTKDMNLLGPAETIDIAYMALYLASDESRVTTGQVFAVDSGATIS